jgi:hypothetical protein
MDWFDFVKGIDPDPAHLVSTLTHYSDAEGVPRFSREVWERLTAAHDKDTIRQALADHIIDNRVPFPYQQITRGNANKAFSILCSRDWRSFVDTYHESYTARFEYDIWGHGLGVIPWGLGFNEMSNHYQQANRYACPGYASRSPLDLWGDRDALASFNWPFWRYTLRGVNRERFRHAFAISAYVAMQFKPQAAKAMYGWMGRGVVLDPSCGWGDRLAGFYCTRESHTYLGSDPNRAVWEVYKQQALDYERLLGGKPSLQQGEVNGVPYFTVRGNKRVTIFNAPAEDTPWEDVVPDGGVDLVFTSPPYFGVERYADGTPSESAQSWFRYPTIDLWLNDFLIPLFVRLSGLVNDGGFCAVNIVDPLWKGKRLPVCRPLHDALVSSGMTYAGVVAMALRNRLSPDGSGLSARYSEPIWVFRRGGEVPSFHQPDVFDLFGEGGRTPSASGTTEEEAP